MRALVGTDDKECDKLELDFGDKNKMKFEGERGNYFNVTYNKITLIRALPTS